MVTDGDGYKDHTTIITSFQAGYVAGTKVAAHTSNAFDKPISSYGGMKIYVKLTGYMQ